MFRTSLNILLLIGFAALNSAAEGGTFTIEPTRLQLDFDGNIRTIRVTNLEERETEIAVFATAWDASPDPSNALPNVLVAPPIFTLSGSSEQIIRVMAREKAPHLETAYRLLIKEVASEVQEDQSGLAFALTVSLPLFVTNPEAKPTPLWSLRSIDNGGAEVVLTNAGEAHIRIDSLEVYQTSAEKPILSLYPNEHTLPGNESVWPLDISLERLKGAVAVKAETNIGPIESVIPLPES